MSASLIVMMVLLAIFIAFISWYGGRGKPLSQQETEQLLTEIQRRGAGSGEQGVSHLLPQLRELAASDDGNEFFMVNLIRWREKALYPAGSPYGDDVRQADARYGKALVPHLIKYAGHPVFMANVMGPFINEGNDPAWQRVAIVRYRSRRDMLRMIAEVANKDVGIHKWASIERTHVFPARSLFDLNARRSLIAALLMLIGFGLHLLLRP